MSDKNVSGNQKPKFSGRQKPNYEPSGHGTYNCRWRKNLRKQRIAEREGKNVATSE